MNTYVLVHGAWLGSWSWDKVAKQLEQAGGKVVIPELPGHGDDQTPVSQVSLPGYVDTVVKAIEAQPGEVVLVGHSMGGIVLSMVAERIPDRISSLVYVAAYLLPSGQSVVQASQAATDSVVGANMVFAPDYSTVSIKPEALREAFAADASDADFEQLRTRTRPEPTGPFNTPLELTPERFGRVRRTYIKTLADRAVTPTLQDAMLAALPAAQVVSLNTGHTPFLSAPEQLAAQIIALSSGAPAAGGA
jgi:pimeloyl-ACP methyl ester carboxylesterase